MRKMSDVLGSEKPHLDPDGWTVTTLKMHYDALLAANDRRLSEVKVENEKALIIKNTADEVALRLAREAQAYKDQQNDALRDKNLQESGIYAKTSDVARMFDDFTKKLDPFLAYVTAQQGGTSQGNSIWSKGIALIAVMVAIGSFAYNILK